ncbi:hypothetical protein IJS77_05090 [bacterium]|nr:hypothetical protein [bacterium]
MSHGNQLRYDADVALRMRIINERIDEIKSGTPGFYSSPIATQLLKNLGEPEAPKEAQLDPLVAFALAHKNNVIKTADGKIIPLVDHPYPDAYVDYLIKRDKEKEPQHFYETVQQFFYNGEKPTVKEYETRMKKLGRDMQYKIYPIAQMEQQLAQTLNSDGFIGFTWDGIKNLFGMQSGSYNVQHELYKLRNLKDGASFENTRAALQSFKEGQQQVVDVTSDIAAYSAAAGAYAAALGGAVAAPFTGGASLSITALALAGASSAGAVTKAGVKKLDAAVGGREYSVNEENKDLLSGATTGAMVLPVAGIEYGAAKVLANAGMPLAQTVVANAENQIVVGLGKATTRNTIIETADFAANQAAKQGANIIRTAGKETGLLQSGITVPVKEVMQQASNSTVRKAGEQIFGNTSKETLRKLTATVTGTTANTGATPLLGGAVSGAGQRIIFNGVKGAAAGGVFSGTESAKGYLCEVASTGKKFNFEEFLKYTGYGTLVGLIFGGGLGAGTTAVGEGASKLRGLLPNGTATPEIPSATPKAVTETGIVKSDGQPAFGALTVPKATSSVVTTPIAGTAASGVTETAVSTADRVVEGTKPTVPVEEVKAETFPTTTEKSITTDTSLSIEDKIKILVEKYGIPQDTYGLSNMNQIKRMIKMNYPVELAELSYNAEQRMPKCEKVLTQTIFSEKAKGKELIEWYQKSFENCGSVNNALREGRTLSGKAREFQEFFDVNQSVLTENTGLIRGSNNIPDVKSGDIITDKGYMSTMTRPGILNVIVEGTAGGDGYYKDFLIIKAKAGQKCIMPRSWGASNSQSEVILPKGTSLRVLEVKALNDNGVIHNGTIITEAVKGRRAIICEIVPAEEAVIPKEATGKLGIPAQQNGVDGVNVVKDAKVESKAKVNPAEVEIPDTAPRTFVIDGVQISTNGQYSPETGDAIKKLFKKWAAKNDKIREGYLQKYIKEIPNLDYENLEQHLKHIKIFMGCESNFPMSPFENGYLSSKEGAEAFESLLQNYSVNAKRGEVSPITIPLSEYKPETILTAKKRNLIGCLDNYERINRLTQMSDEEYSRFMQRVEQQIKESGLSYEELEAKLKKQLKPLLSSHVYEWMTESYINRESVLAQLDLVEILKNYPISMSSNDLFEILSQTDATNIDSFKQVLEKLKTRENVSGWDIRLFFKYVNPKTEQAIFKLLDEKDIPISEINKMLSDLGKDFKCGKISADEVLRKYNAKPLVKTIRAIKSEDIDISPAGLKPTKLDPHNIESSSLALVHLTNYEPENGMILSTRDKLGGSRNSVHFTLNHPVRSHRMGDWDDCPYAVIMPYDSAVSANSAGKFVEGMPNDLYTNGSVAIPEGAVIIKLNPEIEKGTVRVSEFSGKKGVKLVETSEKPYNLVPAVLEKMGYSHIEADGFFGQFSYGKLSGKSAESAMQNFKAWLKFCRNNEIKPTMHSYSPNGVAEGLIESIDSLSANGSWFDRSNSKNYKSTILDEIEQIKKMQYYGYFVSYDLDKLYKIVSESNSPEKALLKIKKELGFHPTVHRTRFDYSFSLPIFDDLKYMTKTMRALNCESELEKLLKELEEENRYY